MNTSLYIATSGLNAYQKKLDTIANNMANAETTGFKKREASFEENLAISIDNQKNASREVGRLTPNGIRTGFGVHITAAQLNLEQGAAKATNNLLDFMIDGKGFFQVGKGNEVFYSRNGSFQQSPTGNGTYRLVNADGCHLMDRNGAPVEIPEGAAFSVNENGVITPTNQQIAVVDFVNPQQLIQQGGNVYRFTGGANEVLRNPAAQIRQGYLEASNVDLSKEITDMLTTQRGFQFNSRSISFADQMMGIANGIIRS